MTYFIGKPVLLGLAIYTLIVLAGCQKQTPSPEKETSATSPKERGLVSGTPLRELEVTLEVTGMS